MRYPARVKLRRAVLLSLALVGCGPRELQPGEKEFEDASLKISGSASERARGNTPAARARAEFVAEAMTELDRKLFTGHDEGKVFSRTGEFLVYGQHAAEGVAFLIHVPQFKRYKDDVRQTLLDAAWAAAEAATRDLGAVRLGVGLRGNLMFGAVAVGTRGSAPTTVELGSSVDTAPLFPFFRGPAPAEAKVVPAALAGSEAGAGEAKEKVDAKAEAPRRPPPRITARTLYSAKIAESLIDRELKKHEDALQGCAIGIMAGEHFDFVLELKGDGTVKGLKATGNDEPPETVTVCLRELARTWTFPKKELGLTRPEVCTIRVGYLEE